MPLELQNHFFLNLLIFFRPLQKKRFFVTRRAMFLVLSSPDTAPPWLTATTTPLSQVWFWLYVPDGKGGRRLG